MKYTVNLVSQHGRTLYGTAVPYGTGEMERVRAQPPIDGVGQSVA